MAKENIYFSLKAHSDSLKYDIFILKLIHFNFLNYLIADEYCFLLFVHSYTPFDSNSSLS